MTCVPTSLLNAFRSELLKHGVSSLRQLQDWVRKESLRAHIDRVSINNESITQQFCKECRIALSEFKARSNGQWVSACDPLLIFMCAALKVSIEHKWTKRNVVIRYKWCGDTLDDGPSGTFDVKSKRAPEPWTRLVSNDRHMWSEGTIYPQLATVTATACSTHQQRSSVPLPHSLSNQVPPGTPQPARRTRSAISSKYRPSRLRRRHLQRR